MRFVTKQVVMTGFLFFLCGGLMLGASLSHAERSTKEDMTGEYNEGLKLEEVTGGEQKLSACTANKDQSFKACVEERDGLSFVVFEDLKSQKKWRVTGDFLEMRPLMGKVVWKSNQLLFWKKSVNPRVGVEFLLNTETRKYQKVVSNFGM